MTTSPVPLTLHQSERSLLWMSLAGRQGFDPILDEPSEPKASDGELRCGRDSNSERGVFLSW